ncbi:MAG: hypothetical protein JXR37_11735 [Kiritimatiellae bacterium]|nr:hypothetical protein [Kiritimatiellia bacterium]
MSGMEVGATFKLGGDEDDKRLEAAQQLAAELSGIECPWHKKSARVQVARAENRELKWAINGACCAEFKRELVKLIEKAGG